MINHFNIQRVLLSLRVCLCSCDMRVIILTKLQIEMLIKGGLCYLVYGGKQTSDLRDGCEVLVRKNNQILEK